MGTLKGVYTPHMVPLNLQDQIDEPQLRRYIDWLIDHGVHGLYPNGSTGEFTRFSVEERRMIVKIACEQARGRVPVLAGAAEANVKETLAACEIYRGYGARAVAIVSPFYYRLGPESVFTYFKEIATNSPIDVTLYNAPLWASPIDVPTIRRLAEFERIIGIKDSSGDVAFMGRMINAVRPNRPDFSFLTGWDNVLMPMLLMGADGGTSATSGIVPELTKRVYELTMSRQLEEAAKQQLQLLALFDMMMYFVEFPAGFQAAIGLRGFNFGPGRLPVSDSQATERLGLQQVLRKMIADIGVKDLAPEASSPWMKSIDREKLQQATEMATKALKQRGMI